MVVPKDNDEIGAQTLQLLKVHVCRAIITLGFIQGFAGIRNNAFFVFLHLGQHGTYSRHARVSAQYKSPFAIRKSEYWCNTRRDLSSLKAVTQA